MQAAFCIKRRDFCSPKKADRLGPGPAEKLSVQINARFRDKELQGILYGDKRSRIVPSGCFSAFFGGENGVLEAVSLMHVIYPRVYDPPSLKLLYAIGDIAPLPLPVFGHGEGGEDIPDIPLPPEDAVGGVAFRGKGVEGGCVDRAVFVIEDAPRQIPGGCPSLAVPVGRPEAGAPPCRKSRDPESRENGERPSTGAFLRAAPRQRRSDAAL